MRLDGVKVEDAKENQENVVNQEEVVNQENAVNQENVVKDTQHQHTRIISNSQISWYTKREEALL